MKPKKLSPFGSSRLQLSLATLFLTIGLSAVSHAASATWAVAPTSGDWNTTANWTAAFPNATGDTATFSNAITTYGGSANPVTPSAAVTVQNITFSGAAGPYVIGVNGAFGIALRGTGAGSVPSYSNTISISSGVTNSQVVAAPLSFSAPSSTAIGYTIRNLTTGSATTLTLSGAITANTATNRATSISLDGTSTGNNTVSGVITSTLANGGVQNVVLKKEGVGTWILAAANVLSGQSMTSTAGALGVQVNAGVLSIQNNQGLGTSGTSGSLQTWVNNNATLELANAITLDNGVTLNLNNGGTIRSSGTITSNAIVKLSTAAAVSGTLATTGSSDVLTIGNAANDLTGGATDTVLRATGPGTVLLGQASNYAGTVSIDAGTLKLGNATALGPVASAGVAFGAGSTGTLQLNGLNPTITSLNTNATVGSPVVENNNATNATLTVSNSSGSSTYAGVLRDGAAGTLALTKAGASNLVLSGASTYTGGTTISNGTLLANNTSGSATGTGAVAVNGTSILGGTGTVSGAVTVASGAAIAPGNGGIGTLSTGSLTLASGSQLNYDLTNASTLDKIAVTGGGTLTINGGQLNINGGTSAFTTNGVYNLIGGYSGSILGTGVSALSVNTLNKDLLNKSYTIGESGGYVTLTIANSGAVVNYWNADANGNWSTGPWTPAVPDAVGGFASFGGGGTAITAPRTVTVDGAFTVGTLSFNNATQAFTLASGSGANITLNNGASGAFVTDTAGSHLIQAPLTTTSNGATFSVVTLGDTLAVSGVISGDGVITKTGNGTLALNAVNTYTGDTNINGGTVEINSADSLGDVSSRTTIGASTLKATADITTTRNFDLTDIASTISVDATKTLSLSGVIGAGAGTLNKAGAGTLVLSGNNTYTGNSTINGGVISINSATSLGAAPGTATPGNIVINNGTLSGTATMTLSANRGITLGNSSSGIDVSSGVTLSHGGTVDGVGTLNLTGSGGTLVLTGTKSYAGGTVVTDATLRSNGSLPANIVLNGTAGLTYTGTATVTGLTVNGTNTVADTGGAGIVMTIASLTGGSGTLNLNHTYVTDFSGSMGAFNGTIVLNGGGYRINGSGGSGNVTFDLNGYGLSMRATATVMALGALTGPAGSNLSGPSNSTQTVVYTVGAKNLTTTYAGVISNGGGGGKAALTKTGSGTLTVTGASSYTGNTTVSLGTLAVENATALGSDVAGTIIDGGDVASKVTIAGSLTLTEPWTLGGRQLTNVDSPAIVSLNGTNVLSGLVSPATGGNTYNIQCDSGSLTMAGDFLPAGAVTTSRYLQLLGAGNAEWSGAIQNGTATVYVTRKGGGSWTLSGNNTYTGNTQIDTGSTLVLATAGQLKFTPTTNDTCNKITGAGTATLNGTFNIDLTGATATVGNTWTLVDATTKTYGSSFAVTGFTKSGTAWTKIDGSNQWTFEQTTGQLSLSLAGYQGWIGSGGYGLTGTDAAAGFDYDNDGIPNGIEFVIGGNPTTATEADKLPTLAKVSGGVEFVFRRTDLSASNNPGAVYSSDMSSWTPAVDGVGGVTVTAANDFYAAGVDKVTVFIPSTVPNLFVRLAVTIP